MAKPIMEVRNLSAHYTTRTGQTVHSVDNVSFALEDGKSLGIAGESGCGKSTLAMSVMGHYLPPLRYAGGTIDIDGKTITDLPPDVIRRTVLGRDIAYIPQAAMNALNPTRRIIHFIRDIMSTHKTGLSKKDVRDLARERFAVLNLPERVLDQYAVELSGGMKQRTVIAVSTLLNPKILVADEPSSALDVTSQKVVIRLLRDLMNKGFVRAMLFITHELPLLYNVSDDIMVMYAGEIVERGGTEDVVFDPVCPYAHDLMQSIIVPERETRGRRLRAIPGAPPDLKNPPPGCRFAERCRFADKDCHREKIGEKPLGENRFFRCKHDPDTLRERYHHDDGE